MENIIVRVAKEDDSKYSQEIVDEMASSAKARGTGIAKRRAQSDKGDNETTCTRFHAANCTKSRRRCQWGYAHYVHHGKLSPGM